MYELIRFRVVTLGLVLLAAMLALPGGTLAAKPVRVRTTIPPHDYIFDGCGPRVFGHEEGWILDTLWLGPDLDDNGIPRFHQQVVHLHIDGTQSANGKSLTYSVDLTFTDPHAVYNGLEEVTLPDGTTQIGASYSVHEGTNGAPFKYRLPHGGVIALDAGRIDYDLSFVILPDGALIVTAQNDLAIHGPHPFFTSDIGCQIINDYLG